MPDVGFHGRREELLLLEDELERALSGHLALVLIEGEAGIGKTRLAAEVSSSAERRGASCFVGRGEELGGRPFGPLADAFACTVAFEEADRAEIGQLLVAGAPHHDPGLQHRLVDAFVDLIDRETLHGGALLVLDDLQWADASTLVTIRSVARRLAFNAFLLIGLFRPWPRSQALERLVDTLTRERASQIVLGPLAHSEVTALARDALGAEPGP